MFSIVIILLFNGYLIFRMLNMMNIFQPQGTGACAVYVCVCVCVCVCDRVDRSGLVVESCNGVCNLKSNFFIYVL